MTYHVPAEGPRDATIALVAEKPEKDEVRFGRPLIGYTGMECREILNELGLDAGFRGKYVQPDQATGIYLTNTVKTFEHFGNPSEEDVKRELPTLYRELASMPNLKCIIAMGDWALKALSNFHLDGITNRRGSVYLTPFKTKFVPTFHTSYYMRGEWRFKPVVKFDINRAIEESQIDGWRLPKRVHNIDPTFPEMMDWFDHLEGAEWLSVDLEVMRPRVIGCFALAKDPKEGFCFPLMRGSTRQQLWSPSQEAQIWRRLQQLFNNPKTRVVGQNFLFDAWHLWRHGINVPYLANGFDTMYAHRVLAPGLPHDLGFLVSIYTDPVEPYYKDESGSWKEFYLPVPDNQFWGYNSKDATTTLEIAWAIIKDLEEYKMYDYYMRYEQRRLPIALKMRQRGMPIDQECLANMRLDLIEKRKKLEAKIAELIGWEPNVRSYLHMEKLFSQLQIDPYRTPTGRPKSDEDSMLAYADKFPHAREEIMACLDITDVRTQVSSFLGLKVASDGHYHAGYNPTKAVTGRDSSEGADDGGPQAQNIPKRIRKIVRAFKGMKITTADLKQAERMVLGWDSGDPLIIEGFEKKKDSHRITACVAYRGWTERHLPPDELLASITKVCQSCADEGETDCAHSERQLSKSFNYAIPYKMGVRKLIKMLRRQNVFMEEREAKRVRDLILSPEIIAWQDRAAAALRRSRWYTNFYGRKREFFGIYDEELIRDYLSNICQSFVGDDVKRAMIYLDDHLPSDSYLMTQTHDSVSIVHPEERQAEIDEILLAAFNNPAVIHGRELVIPVELTHGQTWAGD